MRALCAIQSRFHGTAIPSQDPLKIIADRATSSREPDVSGSIRIRPKEAVNQGGDLIID